MTLLRIARETARLPGARSPDEGSGPGEAAPVRGPARPLAMATRLPPGWVCPPAPRVLLSATRFLEEPVVARICDICDKRRGVGNNVSHANNKTKRTWQPNLQTVHAVVGTTRKTLKVCTRCIRSGKVTKAA